MSRPTIGWYCPFTYPPLSKSNGVELIRLAYEDHDYGSLGVVKLCRKMSSVRSMICSDVLDGLVMVGCCNLSQRLYDLVIEENHELLIYYMRIPRIVDSLFYEILFKEWNRLEQWLNRFYAYKDDKGRQQKDALRNKVNEKSENSAINIINSRSVAWCRLPEETGENVRELSWKNAADIIINNVYCPRLVKGGVMEDRSRINEQESHDLINNIDHECKNTCYHNYALSHAAKGESK